MGMAISRNCELWPLWNFLATIFDNLGTWLTLSNSQTFSVLKLVLKCIMFQDYNFLSPSSFIIQLLSIAANSMATTWLQLCCHVVTMVTALLPHSNFGNLRYLAWNRLMAELSDCGETMFDSKFAEAGKKPCRDCKLSLVSCTVLIPPL